MHLNRAGFLRSGFNFQDSYGMLLCSEWLVHPHKYEHIQFECVPDGINGNFSLDDIILKEASGDFQLYQAKYKDDNNYEWSWGDLLERKKGRKNKLKPSLLQRWESSLAKIENVSHASLVTNARAESTITKHLNNGFVDLKSFQTQNEQVYMEIISQLGGQDRTSAFFSKFRFDFGRDNIQSQIINNLEPLGVNKSGRNQLALMIQEEATRTHTVSLTLDKIRKACNFDQPRALVEDILLPDDFEVFDKNIHAQICTDLASKDGGVRILVGKPGAGKTTYLSYLSNHLKDAGVKLIRHHYYLGPDDIEGAQRLDADRAIEAIKEQLLRDRDLLGESGNKVPSETSLKEYIADLARTSYESGVAAVLIIDGLDHVLRQKNADQLRKLLEEIAYPGPGIWIVLGTQESAYKFMPSMLIGACPREEWIEITGFSRQTVRKIIKSNVTGLRLLRTTESINELTDTIHGITQGNPLHLRYTLQELQNKSPDRYITAEDCKNLVSYGGSIEDYYKSIWLKLDSGSKNMLVLLAGAGFLIKKKWFFEMTTSQPVMFEPKTIVADFSQIQHLILENKREFLSIYHNSFLEFINQSEEFKIVSNSLRKLTLQWLESSASDSLKWSEKRSLEYYLGNSTSIMEIDHEWLIDAICNFRSTTAITKQLNLAIVASFEMKDYGKAFSFHALKNYFENSVEFNGDYFDQVWVEAFRSRMEFIDLNTIESLDFSLLSGEKLYEIVLWANLNGETEISNAVFDRFIDIHPITTSSNTGDQDLPQIPKYFVKSFVHVSDHELERAYRYIRQFRNQGWSGMLFSEYANELIKSERDWMVAELLKMNLSATERDAILHVCSDWLLVSTKSTKLLEIFSRRKVTNPKIEFKLLIAGKKVNYLPSAPNRNEMPKTVKDHDFNGRPERSRYLTEVFLKGAIYGYKNSPFVSIVGDDWLSEVMNLLFEWGYEYGRSLSNSDTYDFTKGLDKFENVQILTWSENRDLEYEFELALRTSFENIASLVFKIDLDLNHSFKLELKKIKSIVGNKRFGSRRLLDSVTRINSSVLSDKSYKYLLNDVRKGLDTDLETFPDRTAIYVKLARLSQIQNDQNVNAEIVKLAARNLMGYGYHKDMYLSSTMDCIQASIDVGVERSIVEDWAYRVSPIAQNVSDFTDGDETRYFPTFLAELLANINMELAYSYYLFQQDAESYYDAQSIFAKYIPKLDTSDPIERALLTTVTDKDGQAALIEFANEDVGAKQILAQIEGYYGGLNPHNERSNTSDNIKDPVYDFSILSPGNLKESLVPGDNPWDSENYLSGWIKYWKDIEEKETYLSLKRAYGDKLIKLRRLLDQIYELAYKYDNRDYAFRLLCEAHIENYGWSPYSTEFDKAKRRWQFLKDHFLNRYEEFLEITLNDYRSEGFSMPIPRVVQFFAFIGDEKTVRDITESAVQFAESLMADINLPNKEWMYKKSSSTTVLLERLKNPSPFTRERAVSALAELVAKRDQEELLVKLIDWISDQLLETYALVGLLTIERSSTIYGLGQHKKLLIRELSKIKVRSVVIEEVMKKIATQEGIKLPIALDVDDYQPPPEDFEVSNFFTKYIVGFLPPAHLDRAKRIEELTWIPFTSFWSFSAQQLLTSLKSREELNNVNYFATPTTDESHLMSASFKLSEVYRTSYLRTLQYFYDQGWMPRDFYLDYCLSTMPIDLSYWSIVPGRIPSWWPEYTNTEELKTNHKRILQSAIDSSEDTKPLFITGALRPSSWSDGSEPSGVQIVAFGYKSIDVNKINEEVLAKEILKKVPLLFQFPDSLKKFEALESHLISLSESEYEKIGETLVQNLVGHAHPLSVPVWQWYREVHGSLLPLDAVTNGLSRSYVPHGFDHKNGKKIIGSYREWSQGINERLDPKALPPFGLSYVISEEFLTNYLRKSGLKLGYAYKTYILEGERWKLTTTSEYGIILPSVEDDK